MSTKHSVAAVRNMERTSKDPSGQLPPDFSSNREPTGFFHGPIWNYGMMCLGAGIALFASLMLAADTLKLARNPNKALGCDVNSVLSCSTVAESWQAEIIKFAGLSFPNAFFGICFYSVFVTVAVVGACNVKLPYWFSMAAWWGGVAAISYSYWLMTQSMFVIKALCPWCMTMMFSTTIMFMALTHATVTVQKIPRKHWRKGLNTYYRMRYDWMVNIVWIFAIIALIFVKEGAAIFA